MQTAGRFLRGLFGTSHSVEDAEHEARARAFQEQVERLKQVRMALQLYSDAIDALSKAEVVVAESFDAYYKACPPCGDDPLPHMEVAASFKHFAVEKYTGARVSITGIVQSRCIKPITAVLSKVGPLEEKIKLRKSLLQDHETHRTSLHREREAGKGAEDPSVQRQSVKLDSISLNLGKIASSVEQGLKEFEDARPHLLAQELAAAVACLFYQGQVTTTLLGRLLPPLPQVASTLCQLHALGSRKQRSSAPPRNKSVAVVLARKEINGGGYGGYGRLDDGGLLVPSGPLQSREAIKQAKGSASGGDGGEGETNVQGGVEGLLLPQDLLDVAGLEPPAATPAVEEEATAAVTAMTAAEVTAGGGSSSPARSPHPVRLPSTRISAPPLEPLSPIDASSDDEEADLAKAPNLPPEAVQAIDSKRASVAKVRGLGLVSGQVPQRPPRPAAKAVAAKAEAEAEQEGDMAGKP